MLLNTYKTKIACQETGKGRYDWIEVESKKCKPFWPVQSGKDLTMRAKLLGPTEESSPFRYSNPHTSLMNLDRFGIDFTMMGTFLESNEGTSPFFFSKPHTSLMELKQMEGGLNVDCQVTKSATVVKFSQYTDGMATVLLVNHTKKATVLFNQSGCQVKHELSSQQYMLYTWDNAIGTRKVIWTCGEHRDQENDLQRDGKGEFCDKLGSTVYWVSFLNGMQRVLLFTELEAITREIGKLERIDQEINFSIQGIGLSLINDYKQKEVAYIEITRSEIIWEEETPKRFILSNEETGDALEKSYQEYITKLEAGESSSSTVSLGNKIEVNWNEMMMYKPNRRQIRRTCNPGVWFQFNRSAQQIHLHAKIQKLQVDNQKSDATFQTVFTATPLPKSMAADNVPKPLTELSIAIRKPRNSTLLQFKYFKILTQEMTLKIDFGFVNEILDLFKSSKKVSTEQQANLLEEDFQTVLSALIKEESPSLKKKNFYDYLHISPIKIHLSLSLQGLEGDGQPAAINSDYIKFVLKSFGGVLFNFNDVIIKIGYFQKVNKFYDSLELGQRVGNHYISQATPLYPLLFELDVLGNPVGLIRGVAGGVHDLFYEPYQGAIKGPMEFKEGLNIGVKSLFGNTVGGAAGAISRMTGFLGKGLAALTFDDEYKKKRREAIIGKRTANTKERLARGGKGVVMGVFHGVTGVVTKPMEGAKTDGVGGFFKGLGKGLVGVVTKPTGGVVDFASSSFEGIRRITHRSDEVRRLRNPRMFSFDKILRPYNRHEADGYKILQEIEDGKFASSDHYIAHVVISRHERDVLLVTDKRIIYANRGMILGQWDVEWLNTWGEIKETPKRIPRGIAIELKVKEKKFPFGKGSEKKEINIEDPRAADFIHGKMVDIFNRQN